MQWKDTQLIGETLADLYPDIDPLKLRFTELHAMVVALQDFDDDPNKSTEGSCGLTSSLYLRRCLLQSQKTE